MSYDYQDKDYYATYLTGNIGAALRFQLEQILSHHREVMSAYFSQELSIRYRALMFILIIDETERDHIKKTVDDIRIDTMKLENACEIMFDYLAFLPSNAPKYESEEYFIYEREDYVLLCEGESVEYEDDYDILDDMRRLRATARLYIDSTLWKRRWTRYFIDMKETYNRGGDQASMRAIRLWLAALHTYSRDMFVLLCISRVPKTQLLLKTSPSILEYPYLRRQQIKLERYYQAEPEPMYYADILDRRNDRQTQRITDAVTEYHDGKFTEEIAHWE